MSAEWETNGAEVATPEAVAAEVPASGEPEAESSSAPAVEAPRSAIGRDQLWSERLRRRLVEQQQVFARMIGARLTAYLQTETVVPAVAVQTVSGERFVDRIITPSQVSVWKLAPLTGMGMLEWAGVAALRVVDLLMGGRGTVADPDRSLSEIERALFDQVTQMWMEEWCAAWEGEPRLEPVLLGHELDAGCLGCLGRDSWMVEFSFVLGLCDETYPIRLGFPLAMLEPRIRRWEQEQSAAECGPATRESASTALSWNPVLSAVPVEVRAVMRLGTVPVRQLATMRTGEALWADGSVARAVEVWVGGVRKFEATAGRADGRWALQINRRVEDTEHEQHQ